MMSRERGCRAAERVTHRKHHFAGGELQLPWIVDWTTLPFLMWLCAPSCVQPMMLVLNFARYSYRNGLYRNFSQKKGYATTNAVTATDSAPARACTIKEEAIPGDLQR